MASLKNISLGQIGVCFCVADDPILRITEVLPAHMDVYGNFGWVFEEMKMWHQKRNRPTMGFALLSSYCSAVYMLLAHNELIYWVSGNVIVL